MDQWHPNACPHSSPLAPADMVTTAGTSTKSFVAEDARILKAINVLLNMFPYMRCFLRRITTVGAAVSFRPPFNHRLNSCQGTSGLMTTLGLNFSGYVRAVPPNAFV